VIQGERTRTCIGVCVCIFGMQNVYMYVCVCVYQYEYLRYGVFHSIDTCSELDDWVYLLNSIHRALADLHTHTHTHIQHTYTRNIHKHTHEGVQE